MKKKICALILVLLTITGCRSNNSDVIDTGSNNTVKSTDNSIDTNGTVSLVFVDSSTRTLTQNSEQVSIVISVLGPNNAPYSEGEVSIAYPDKVKNGVDVGSFVASSVPIVNGKATFSYTGPSDLASLVAKGDLSTIFGFYHSSDLVNVHNLTFNYSPAPDQVVFTDYELKQGLDSDSYQMALESSRQMVFYVQNDQGSHIGDESITSINVKLLNPALAELINTLGQSGNTLSFNKNDVSVSLISNTISGLVPIEVTAVFTDINSNVRTLTKVFNITILSGPPTAMSISYAGTTQDSDNAEFQENLIVKVTDKYSNLVNTQPALSVYLIAGYALENLSDPSSRIYFNTTDAKSATLDPTTNTLSATGVDFSNVDEDNDFLLTFANGYAYNASGKWDFTKVGAASSHELVLKDSFKAAASVTNIGYVIGNNYRQDRCRDAQEWLATAHLVEGNDRLDSTGVAKLRIDYDYYLSGKDVVVGVELVGDTVKDDLISKFGEAKKLTLQGEDLSAGSYSFAQGYSGTVRFYIGQKNTPNENYRNANFEYNVEVSGDGNTYITSDSMSQPNGIYSCNDDGRAYVDVTITSAVTAGTITVNDIKVKHEF